MHSGNSVEGCLPVKRLFLAGIAVLFLATGIAHAHDPLINRDPDWIFRCSVQGNVYIYEGSSGFIARNLEPPFQLSWAADRVLTVGNEKCELIYPVEQG
jgi:hypothetical protein